MKKIKWPVILVTAYAFFYRLAPHLGFPDSVVLSMFVMSPVVVCWLAYKILKDGARCEKTFDEYFYEDVEYRRNIG
ncbi:MAG: hypothetical protein JWP81_2592 [Ferruginibacter sp.]|nr:hypothetical protein [Ferruginibacter sp.]